jgi:hypothetical protein
MAAAAVLAPLPAAAVPEPPERSVAQLLTDLQQMYRKAGQATGTYNATTAKLNRRRAELDLLESRLSRARLSLYAGRDAAGRLARQQYQSSTDISPYVRLLLAHDPQRALEQSHVIGQLARERAKTVGRLAASERHADELARRARKALDDQLSLTAQQKKQRNVVHQRLKDIEELLASLTPEQLSALAEFELPQEGD